MRKKIKARQREQYKQRFCCYVPNERPQRNQELLGLTAERPGDDRGGYKQLREETGGFSLYFTSNLLEQKNLVGCTAQPCTDKAVRRNGFERQLSRRLMVLCTHNFEGLRESYGPIPSVLKLDCVKDRHPGYSCQVECVRQVLNSCTHAHTRTDTDFLQQKEPRLTSAADNITSAAVCPKQPLSKTMKSLSLYILKIAQLYTNAFWVFFVHTL